LAGDHTQWPYHALSKSAAHAQEMVNAVVSGDYDNDISDHKCLKVTVKMKQH
jgi:hypothetical protein